MRLIFIIKHPIIAFQAWQRRNYKVVNLDHPEYNCRWCGCDHHHEERI